VTLFRAASGIRFANLFLAGLVAGTMFGIWLGYDPRKLSPSAFIEQHQNAVRALNVTMPALGAICIVLTIIHAYLARFRRSASNTLLAAAILFIAAGFITRFGNQPINATVMTWQADAPPPPGWTDLRDQWWQWHVERTAAGLLGFILVVAASVRDERS